MARFYVGQPVVCVWSPEKWDKEDYVPESDVPRLGQRYIVQGYRVMNYVDLRGFKWCYDEEGFAPITDEQVRGIVEEAHRMGPWTGGVHWNDREREDA